jgi:adenylate kinase
MNLFRTCPFPFPFLQDNHSNKKNFPFQVRTISFQSKNEPFRIVLIGAPGSGKGTQCSFLERDFGLVPISTGQLLRNAISMKKFISSDIEAIVSKGGLVPDEIVLELLKSTLTEENTRLKGWVLDGYPRTILQAEQLKHMVRALNQPLTTVFYLKINEETIYERIKDRWIHLPSGRNYNVVYKPPKVPGLDDVTGEPLVKRNDDSLETIRERLKAFEEESLPILEMYKAEGILVPIDASTSTIGYKAICDHLARNV